MGGSSSSLKVSMELYEDARLTGKLVSRSAGAQIEFWARLGRNMEQKLTGAQIHSALGARGTKDVALGEVTMHVIRGYQDGTLADSFRRSVARESQAELPVEEHSASATD